jgi:hypothetical protein
MFESSQRPTTANNRLLSNVVDDLGNGNQLGT